MPCESGPSFEQVQEENDRNDAIARFMCDTFSRMTKREIEQQEPALQRWWEDHQHYDRQRKKFEKKQAIEQEIGKAIKKLRAELLEKYSLDEDDDE